MRDGALQPCGAQPGESARNGKSVSLRQRALRMLAHRDYSRRELESKLKAHAADAVELNAVLDHLQASGWLSEQRVAQQLVQRAAGRYGTRKVLQQLHEKGVGPEGLERALTQLQASELNSARHAWCKRFGKQPSDAAEWARQARFLEQRGFDTEVIQSVLGASIEE